MKTSATDENQCKGGNAPETKSQAPQEDWIKILKILSIKKMRMPLSK